MNDEITVIEQVFRQVRAMLLERVGAQAHETKADGSPVTGTDVEIESIIMRQLAEQFPDLPVFGEESGYDEQNLPERCWLVDPIDGTESFILGIPAFTNMAVLIEKSIATACVIYNPSRDEMYTARLGEGAFKNGERLDLASVPIAATAYCKTEFVAELEAIMAEQHVRCEKGAQGAGHGFAAVADGRIAARFNMKAGGYVHDYAPGALLVREAGGAIIPILDDTYNFRTRSFVACHPALETILRPHIEHLGELERLA